MDRSGPSLDAGASASLRALSQLPPCAGRPEVRVFAKVRNEAMRLPHFLAHYRKLGADRFLVVDNQSTDGTAALLLGEPGVHLFAAAGSFAAAGGGQAWLDALLDRYGPGHWCLTVDADELLCFPGSETLGLPALCGSLDREGAEALPCVMLDMYGSEPLGSVAYAAGEPFLDACPWFDPGPYWRTSPSGDCPPQEIYGGVRQRVFYPHWQAPSVGLRLSERCYDVANRSGVIRRNRAIQSWRAKRPPNLAKVPLVRWRRGLRYLAVTHRITPVRLSAGSACLLHFKFLGDFRATAAGEAKRGEYFDDAREYKRYAAVMAEASALSLWSKRSVRFEGTAQLCRLGLMTPLPIKASPSPGNDVTVCVCTHDRPDYLRACLAGLARQTIPSDRFEVIVVDSFGSPAATEAATALVGAMPNARLVRVDRPGLSLARNAGARAARGAYLAYLDDDAVAAPDWVERIMDAIARSARPPAVLAGRILPAWEQPLPGWWPPRLVGALSLIEWAGAGEFRSAAVPATLEPYGANMIVRRDALLAGGGFNEAAGRRGAALLSDEDVQLAWTLQDRGEPVLFDGSIVVRHSIQASRLQPRWLLRRLYWQGASTVHTRRMLGDRRFVWRNLLRRLAVTVLLSWSALLPLNSTRLIGARWRLAYSLGFLSAALARRQPEGGTTGPSTHACRAFLPRSACGRASSSPRNTTVHQTGHQ